MGADHQGGSDFGAFGDFYSAQNNSKNQQNYMKTSTNINKIRLIGAALVMCATAAWAMCSFNVLYQDCTPNPSGTFWYGTCPGNTTVVEVQIMCPSVTCGVCQSATDGEFKTCYAGTILVECQEQITFWPCPECPLGDPNAFPCPFTYTSFFDYYVESAVETSFCHE